MRCAYQSVILFRLLFFRKELRTAGVAVGNMKKSAGTVRTRGAWSFFSFQNKREHRLLPIPISQQQGVFGKYLAVEILLLPQK